MDFHLPELGEGVYEAEVVRWLVRPGDTVKRAQVLLEMLTDKATMEVPAPFAGTIDLLEVEPGQQVKIGDVLLRYSAEVRFANPSHVGMAPAAFVPAAVAARPLTGNGLAPTPAHIKAAPSVRLMAHKLGVDLSHVAGSGPEGRVLAGDLHPTASPPKTVESPEYGMPGTRIKLQGLRRRIAEHMVEAKQAIPHYTYVDECDVTDLVKLRDSIRDSLAPKGQGQGEGEWAGVKITYLAFFVKAVARALQEVPLVNSSLDDAAAEIVLHNKYHIGIAVATSGGLIVPVIRDADRKSLLDIARDVERLSAEARAGKSRREDVRGGTFTVTSIGNVGGLFATPIINHPETAILGIGKIVKRPVFDENERVRPAHMVYLSLTCDHRVLDGAVAAAFGNALIKKLQNPSLLLL